MSRIAKAPLESKIFALVLAIMSVVALFVAFRPDREVENGLGWLCIIAGLLEMYHGFRRATEELRSLAWKSGAKSILMGLFLVNAALFIDSALALFVAGTFLWEIFNYLRAAKEQTDPYEKKKNLFAAIGNALVIAVMFVLQKRGVYIALAIAISMRLIGIALSILSAKLGVLNDVSEDLMQEMKYSDNKEIADLAEQMEKEEEARAQIDRYWITTFIMILFFIHLGRMGFDRSFLGILSPLVAVIGDVAIALIIAYAVQAPLTGVFRKMSSSLERTLWQWVQQVPPEERKQISVRNAVSYLLKSRMRARVRMRKAGYSFPVAIRMGLKTGLPWSALLAAIMPVLGMSWYFDTENWASGIWDTWAAQRSDEWRMAMTRSTGVPITSNAFRVAPEGLNDSADFSFIVVGDPGEGDASQLVLKDQIIKVADQKDVRFVVISSDVIYPSGAMKDYERKFYMPLKGVTKPVFAIPGNHDWYDALEGFVANFYTPEAARRSMQARLNEDLNISSTTQENIEEMVEEAKFLRKEYQVPTGYQQAPYFQVSTAQFVLLCIDTGVKREVDSLQLEWVKKVLANSKGKFVMALLGHPFYAIGEYQGSMNPEFEALHALFRQHKVPVVMAGDTHDFEYYPELAKNNDGHTMHHFVNGGGGAYLSIGTALAKAYSMPTEDYAYYPSKDPLISKINKNTSWYKYPAWWYTKKFDGWPFSAEWLSAAFDYNVAPFFQSFMEVRVEPSKKRVRYILYSQYGPLQWKDITTTPGARPDGVKPEDFVEWSFPMLN
jgi:hypothetical protein